MKKLSTSEWIGVGIAVIIAFAILGPGFGLFGENLPGVDTPGNIIMDDNTTNEPFTVVEGVEARILKEGTGDTAEVGNLVAVHYEGRLQDGTVFDSSYQRGEPFSFTLGAREVIPGWDAGVTGMKEGEIRQLTIDPALAYGPQGIQDPRTGEYVIPQNAVLIFDVELIDAGISRQ